MVEIENGLCYLGFILKSTHTLKGTELNINPKKSKWICYQLNYPVVEVENGLCYLDFILKSIAYFKKD